MPMSLFLDNCVLCFQCTSPKIQKETKKTRFDPAQSLNQARDQNPLSFWNYDLCSLIPLSFSIPTHASEPPFKLYRAEWEYKLTTLCYSLQIIFFYT
jgi:hypothetical protein